MKSVIIEGRKLRFRRTVEADLDYVLAAESDGDNAPYVAQWSRQQHQEILDRENLLHIILEETIGGARVGYVIMAGHPDENGNLEFRRLVITDKGKGWGREALELAKEFAFDHQKAHRLWLDVREHNQRARNLYQQAGFVEEGIFRECVWADEQWQSLVIMTMLEGEYEKKMSCKKGPSGK